MSVTYSTSVKNARLTAVLTAIGAAGQLVIGTAGMAAVLASLALNNPAGSVAAGVLTFNASGVSAAASASGTAAEAKITDGTNDLITGLTVGTSGTDIVISNTNVSSGQTVTLNSGSITAG